MRSQKPPKRARFFFHVDGVLEVVPPLEKVEALYVVLDNHFRAPGQIASDDENPRAKVVRRHGELMVGGGGEGEGSEYEVHGDNYNRCSLLEPPSAVTYFSEVGFAVELGAN